MKKITAILLALLLLLMTGCSGNSENPAGNVESLPAATQPDNSGTVETAPAAEDTTVSLGRMEGGVYTNSYAGFGCQLDANWTFYTAEELQELPENVAEMFADSELMEGNAVPEQISDMMAENVNDLTTINVLYTKLSMQERLLYAAMSHEAALDTVMAQKDSLIATYEQAGYTVESMEIVTVTFLGEEYPALYSVMTIEGVSYYTLQLMNYKVGQYGVTLTLASFLEDNTGKLLELFYAVE